MFSHILFGSQMSEQKSQTGPQYILGLIQKPQSSPRHVAGKKPKQFRSITLCRIYTPQYISGKLGEFRTVQPNKLHLYEACLMSHMKHHSFVLVSWSNQFSLYFCRKCSLKYNSVFLKFCVQFYKTKQNIYVQYIFSRNIFELTFLRIVYILYYTVYMWVKFFTVLQLLTFQNFKLSRVHNLFKTFSIFG